jgi:hypothetical protein
MVPPSRFDFDGFTKAIDEFSAPDNVEPVAETASNQPYNLFNESRTNTNQLGNVTPTEPPFPPIRTGNATPANPPIRTGNATPANPPIQTGNTAPANPLFRIAPGNHPGTLRIHSANPGSTPIERKSPCNPVFGNQIPGTVPFTNPVSNPYSGPISNPLTGTFGYPTPAGPFCYPPPAGPFGYPPMATSPHFNGPALDLEQYTRTVRSNIKSQATERLNTIANNVTTAGYMACSEAVAEVTKFVLTFLIYKGLQEISISGINVCPFIYKNGGHRCTSVITEKGKKYCTKHDRYAPTREILDEKKQQTQTRTQQPQLQNQQIQQQKLNQKRYFFIIRSVNN